MRSLQSIIPARPAFVDSHDSDWDQAFLFGVLRTLRCQVARRVLDLGVGSTRSEGIFEPLCADTTVVRADIRDIASIPGHFDLVVCQTVLCGLSDPVAAVRAMMRACRQDGAILIAEAVTLLERTRLYQAIDNLQPHESAALVQAWSAYHRGVRIIYGHDHDIALRMPGVLRAAGLDPALVSTWRNPCVSQARNRVAGLSAQFTGDKLTLAQAAGLTIEDWEKARRAALKLEASATRTLCHDDGLYLFGFRNP